MHSLTWQVRDYSTAATSPDDYLAVNEARVFPANTPAGTPVCVNIPIVVDTELEGDEEFIVTSHFEPFLPVNTSVTIQDGIYASYIVLYAVVNSPYPGT